MISVLVVDDSVVVRRLITDALVNDPRIKVVGTASNGRIALAKIDQLNPDIVTLDVEMPVMDGLTTLRELRRQRPRLPVIMFSAVTAAGATATLDALAAGASDYVTKPHNVRSIAESIENVRQQLIPRIHALCERSGVPRRPVIRPPSRPASARPPAGTVGGGVGRVGTGGDPAGIGVVVPARAAPVPAVPGRPVARPGGVDVVAIGCSTGGPDALSRLIRALPAHLPVPVVVVQHMPPVFTRMFAERLNRTAAVTVLEAVGETPLAVGTVYIAPGDFHLELQRRKSTVLTRLSSAPPENFCRPAVDVLFRSVALTYGRTALAMVLTGMGQDGRRGCEPLRAAGAEIIAQDEATSVVWGMPGAVVAAGLADAVLPLDELADFLIARTAGGRGARPLEVTR